MCCLIKRKEKKKKQTWFQFVCASRRHLLCSTDSLWENKWIDLSEVETKPPYALNRLEGVIILFESALHIKHSGRGEERQNQRGGAEETYRWIRKAVRVITKLLKQTQFHKLQHCRSVCCGSVCVCVCVYHCFCHRPVKKKKTSCILPSICSSVRNASRAIFSQRSSVWDFSAMKRCGLQMDQNKKKKGHSLPVWTGDLVKAKQSRDLGCSPFCAPFIPGFKLQPCPSIKDTFQKKGNKKGNKPKNFCSHHLNPCRRLTTVAKNVGGVFQAFVPMQQCKTAHRLLLGVTHASLMLLV